MSGLKVLAYCWTCLPKSKLDEAIDPRIYGPEIQMYLDKPICDSCADKKRLVEVQFEKWSKEKQ